MKLYQINRVQLFKQPIEEIWEFFSTPHNLGNITPSYLGFETKSELPEETYAGLIIEYKIKPLFNIPVTWVTEITRLKKPLFFIDEQRIGPYAFWHHQHWFRSVPGGTEVRDLVHYGLPFGILGRFLHRIYIKRQLDTIFDYRQEALNRLFPQGSLHSQTMP